MVEVVLWRPMDRVWVGKIHFGATATVGHCSVTNKKGRFRNESVFFVSIKVL